MSGNNQGWFQCSQCGHGHIVYKWQFEGGDYILPKQAATKKELPNKFNSALITF